MDTDPSFLAGREQQLRDLIEHPGHRTLDEAACVGTDPEAYHPDQGRPDELALRRCRSCPIQLACLALALRAEDPDARAGWYGGLGPAERDRVAAHLRSPIGSSAPTGGPVEAAQLRAAGRTVTQIAARLGCSRRTVQRYLRDARRAGVLAAG